MKQGTLQTSSCYCDVCGAKATQYMSYDVVLYRRCSSDPSHNVVDTQKYSTTTSRHQNMVAAIEPEYATAVSATGKQKLPDSPLSVTPVLPRY